MVYGLDWHMAFSLAFSPQPRLGLSAQLLLLIDGKLERLFLSHAREAN